MEQQRLELPSLYDLRIFQINVEEGAPVAMVYLLTHRNDGRKPELSAAVRNPDKPRILNVFIEPIEDWLSFFCFATFGPGGSIVARSPRILGCQHHADRRGAPPLRRTDR